jgi:hypothetical protein
MCGAAILGLCTITPASAVVPMTFNGVSLSMLVQYYWYCALSILGGGHHADRHFHVCTVILLKTL